MDEEMSTRGKSVIVDHAKMAAKPPSEVSPDPKGNRAQRRAWAKLAKTKTPPAPSAAPSGTESGQ
jgi:hypothetical protein